MALSRFVLPVADVGSGIKPSVGAQLFFFDTGTGVPKDTFNCPDGTTANSNPVIADASGLFPDIFWAGTFKVILKDRNNVQIWERDPVTSFLNSSDSTTVKNFKTLALAISDITLNDGDTVYIKERTLGNSGGGNWDVVLLSTVTVSPGAPTIGGIVASTGNNTLALVLTELDSMNVNKFGVVYDDLTDQTEAYEALTAGTVPEVITSGVLTVNRFAFPTDDSIKNFKGLNGAELKFTFVSATSWASFKSGCSYEGIKFNSTELDRDNQRTEINGHDNVTIKKCQFFNHVHISASPNAWGLYLKNCNNAVIESCIFENNTQSDLVLVDDVTNVTVINSINETDGGVSLNVEPNTGFDGTRGASFIGGDYRSVTLLENDNLRMASSGLSFSSVNITNLTYDGSGASFVSCVIGSIGPEEATPGTATAVFGGALKIDNLQLSKNLIEDERFFDVSRDDVLTYWQSIFSTAPSGDIYERQFNINDGVYIRINPTGGNFQMQVATRNFITCTALETLCVTANVRTNMNGTGGFEPDKIRVEFFDVSDVSLLQTVVKCIRSGSGSSAKGTTTGFVVAPTSAVKFKVLFGKLNTSTSFTDFFSVGVYRFELNVKGGNFNSVVDSLSSNITKNELYYQDHIPSGSNVTVNHFQGERIIRKNPAASTVYESTCIIDGAPGNWQTVSTLP